MRPGRRYLTMGDQLQNLHPQKLLHLADRAARVPSNDLALPIVIRASTAEDACLRTRKCFLFYSQAKKIVIGSTQFIEDRRRRLGFARHPEEFSIAVFSEFRKG